MLVNGSLANLIDGVSQQPPSQRKATHCDLADNCYLSPSDGLTKRPPFAHVAKLANYSAGTYPANLRVHFIDRSETEKYLMVFDGSVAGPQVYDLAGNSYPVVKQFGTASFAYVNTANPHQDLHLVTIADTTFVANRQIVVQQTVTPSANYAAPVVYFWVRASAVGIYRLYVDGVAGSYTAIASDTTTIIAANLATALGTALGVNYTIHQNGPVVSVVRTNSASMNADYFDPSGGAAVTMANSEGTPDFGHLPPAALETSIAKVQAQNNGSSATVPYYVKFHMTNWTLGTGGLGVINGTWFESPGSQNWQDQLTNSTMPFQLIRLIDDNVGTVTGTPNQIYFQYGPSPWGARLVGDSTYDPAPSFVGKTINDIFLFQGRLGVLTDTNLVLSQAGNFYNFWRTTMLAVPASDPIDVSAAHPRVVQLRHAIPWQRELVIFGDKVQFVVAADGNVVAPSTISMTAATEYDADLYCKPVPIANMLYFPYRINGYTAVREYYIEFYTQRHVSRSITDHVPKYLSGNPLHMAHCISSDMLAVLADNDRSSLFVYKFAWAGNTLYSGDKSQSAWSRWNFDQPGVTTRIYGHTFVGQTMYLVVGRSFVNATGGTDYQLFLESATMDALPNDPGQTFTTYVDRKVATDSLTATYSSGTGLTTITLPYDVPPQATVQVVQNPGVLLAATVVNTATNQVTVKGDWSGGALHGWVGLAYTMRFRFSTFYMRQQNQQNQQSVVLNGRLQIRTVTTRFVNTGYFRYEITPFARDLNTQAFTGLAKGNAQMVLGTVPLLSDQYRVLVQARNDLAQIDIVNDSPLPSRFSSAEWEGEFYQRARST